MQVKVCPECGVENKVDNAMCSACYASLDGVAATLSKKTDEQPAAPAQPQPGPAPAAPSPGAGPSGPVAGPSGTVPPGGSASSGPPFSERPRPVKQGSGSGITAFLLIIIVLGGAFAAWWFLMKPKSPDQVVQAFVGAALEGDYKKAKPYMTKATIAELEKMYGSEEKIAADLKNNVAMTKDAKLEEFTFEEPVYEGESTAIVAIGLPSDPSNPMQAMAASFKPEMVLLKEDGKWKFDMKATGEHMQKQIEEMFQGVGPGVGGG